MADQPHPRTHTEIASERGPTGNTQYDDHTATSMGGTVAVVCGALGVIAGIIPRLGVGAVILAVIALVAGVPAMRGDRESSASKRARIGVFLAVAALVLGALNIAIQLDLFDYFTAE